MLPYTSSVHHSTSSHTANYFKHKPNVCHPKKAKILHKNTIVVTCRKLRTRNANQARCPASSELQLLPAHGMGGDCCKSLIYVFFLISREWECYPAPTPCMQLLRFSLEWTIHLSALEPPFASQCPFTINSNKMQEDSLLKRLGWTKGVYIHEC